MNKIYFDKIECSMISIWIRMITYNRNLYNRNRISQNTRYLQISLQFSLKDFLIIFQENEKKQYFVNNKRTLT